MESYSLIFNNANSIIESEEYRTTEESFARALIDILEDFYEVENVNVVHYSLSKNDKEIWKVNGFYVNEEDEDYQIDLFITEYSEKPSEVVTINTQNVNVLKNKITRFLKHSIDGKYDEIQEHSIIHQLAQDIYKKKKKISKVDLYIITNMRFPKIEKLQIDDSIDNIDLNYHYWDIERFDRLLKSKLERNTININFDDFFKGGIPAVYIEKSSKYQCILTVFPGELLADLYRLYDTKLLESNVRVFLQQTGKVNKGIRDTIRDNGEMFLTYNNGISATCSDIKLKSGRLYGINDLQIVNGGQTTASLYYTRKKFSSDLSKIDVQVKITLIKDQSIKEIEVPKISEYANTQNKVSQLDLNSNHPYLVKLEEMSRKISFKDIENKNLTKYWFFERVNGAYREAISKESTPARQKTFRTINPREFSFKKIDIARWINLFDQLPHEVSKGGQRSFMFLINNHAKENLLNVDNDYYYNLIGKGILFKWFDKCFGRLNQNPVGDTNVKSYTVNYTLSLLYRHIGDKLNLKKIASIQFIHEDHIDSTRTFLKFTYDYLVKKASGGLISETSKKKTTWDEFQHQTPPIKLSKVFEDILIDKNNQELVIDSDPYEYLIKLTSITSRGSNYWDALYIFSGPEHSSDKLSISDKQIIEKGYNYFFRLRGTLSYDFIETLKNFISNIEDKFDVQEILKLSKRTSKQFPDFTKLHEILKNINRNDLEEILNSKKIQKSKAKERYKRAINSYDPIKPNYEKMTLDELRYLGWALGIK